MSLRDLLSGTAPDVAPLLLGMRLENTGDGTAVIITEVEAYTESDPASHSYRGLTAPNASMFEQSATLYVYRSYGLHWCANVVTGLAGSGEAVLLRGAMPERRIDLMEARRGRADHLTDGPGKLCASMGITGQHDGSDLITGPFRLSMVSTLDSESTNRIGISVGQDRKWRFVAHLLPQADSLPLPSHTDET